MKRPLTTSLLLILPLLVATNWTYGPTNPTNGPCELGPTVGGTTDTSFVAYCRDYLDKSTMSVETVQLEIRPYGVGSFHTDGTSYIGTSATAYGVFVTVTQFYDEGTSTWTNLLPDSHYEVRFHSTTHSTLYSNVWDGWTAPAEGTASANDVVWAFFADEINQTAITGSTATTENGFASAAGHHPQMTVMLGDEGHNNPGTSTNAKPYAWDARYGRGEYQVSLDFHNDLESHTSYDVVFDDHDAGTDNTDWTCQNVNGTGRCTAEYLKYYDWLYPHYSLPLSGELYHVIKWGSDLRAFVLDDRSRRDFDTDPRGSAGTASQPTMLGADQDQQLLDDLQAAQDDGVKFKLLVSPSAMDESPTMPTAASATSVTPATGHLTFATQANLCIPTEDPDVCTPIAAGVHAGAASRANAHVNYVEGTIYSYSGTTLVIDVPSDGAHGTGAHTDWNISVGGKPDSWGSFVVEHQALLDYITVHSITGVVVVTGDSHSWGRVDDGSGWGGLPEMSNPSVNIDLNGCTYYGQNVAPLCAVYDLEGAEVHPHSGFGLMTIHHNGDGTVTLTLQPYGYDDTARGTAFTETL